MNGLLMISDKLRRGLAARRHALTLFVVLLSCYAYFFPRWADWNQNSRLDLVLAIVEKRTFSIDDYYQNTGDYAVYNGRRYTDKAPGLSFLGVPAYGVFKALASVPIVDAWLSRSAANAAVEATLLDSGTGISPDKLRMAAALYVLTFFVVSLPSALLWVLVYSFLGHFWYRRGLRLLVTLAFGLGTVAFPYSTVFYSHQTGAFLVFAAFYVLFRIRRRALSSRYLYLVGALLGLAAIVEYPTVLVAVILAVYAATWLSRKKRLALMIVGGLPWILLLGFYNYVSFGSPISSSYRYLALFPEQSNYGFLGFSYPRWSSFWGITFSPYRGLFFSSPFLLLVVPGFWLIWRTIRDRAELFVCLSVVATYFVLISSYFDWKGGFAVAGPRNLIPMLPFAALPVFAGAKAVWQSGAGRLLVGGLACISIAVTTIQAAAGQAFAPTDVLNPFFQFFLPKLLSGDINRNLGMLLNLPSWYSLLPLILAVVAFLGILIAGGRTNLWSIDRELTSPN